MGRKLKLGTSCTIAFCVGLPEMSPFNSRADDLSAHGIGGGPADNTSRSVSTFSSLIINYFRYNILLYDFFLFTWYCSVFNSFRPHHLTRFNVCNLLNDYMKKHDASNKCVYTNGKPWQFHLQLCCLIFFSANNITYPMSIYLYTHWKLRSFFYVSRPTYALLNIY